MEQRQPAGVKKQSAECLDRTMAAGEACSGSLLPGLIYAQALYDFPKLNAQGLDIILDNLRGVVAYVAGCPLNTADLECAKVIATFDEDVFTLALLLDVRECADSGAYWREALACLAKAPAQITDLHRQAVNLAKSTPGQSVLAHFIDLRDSMHAAEAARRLQRVQTRAGEEDTDRAVAAAPRVMAGEGTAQDRQEVAAGLRVSADQGDADAQFLTGALLARGGGGVKKNLPLGKRYLELSAAAGTEAAVTLLKELRRCVGCGELDVHHMICSQCRNARYCDDDCQQRHWQCLMDPHQPHCVPRRETAGAGGSSDCVEPPAHLDLLNVHIAAAAAGAAAAGAAAAAAARVAGNDLFREQKYPEAGLTSQLSTFKYNDYGFPGECLVHPYFTRGSVSLWYHDFPTESECDQNNRYRDCSDEHTAAEILGPTPRRSSSTPSPSSSTPTTRR